MPLEPDSRYRAEAEAAVSAVIERFLAARADNPVSADETKPALIEELLNPPPETGQDLESLLAAVERAVDTGYDTASGRFLAYIPSGGLFSAALGTYLGGVVNRYSAASHVAPGMVAIEQSVIHWMASRLRLDAQSLATAMAEDVQAGLRPMMVAATAGTTDTGAIDPLEECAELAKQRGAWFHVDAAYGGFFQLTERGRQRLTGIERADSITVDAHKSLFLPFGFGGLLVRDVADLVDAHEGHGAYMQDVVAGELPQYMAMGPEQTRPNRGLPMWLALNLHGVSAFRQTLDSMLDLTEHAARRLAATNDLELITEPELSVVAFRSILGDDVTSQILTALNDSGRVHVSSTTIGDRLWIRLVFLSQRTTREIVDDVIDLVVSMAVA